MLYFKMKLPTFIYICGASILTPVLISGCEGRVGHQNSKALREAEKYWKIKKETVVPLKEVAIESGSRVTYSTDFVNFKTVEIHHYNKGLKFHKLNYPKKEEKIQKRYKALLSAYEK